MASDADTARGDDGELGAYSSDIDNDMSDLNAEEEDDEPAPLLRTGVVIARRKAARSRAPRGPLQPIRRRAVPPDGAAGRRQKKFLLWRERYVDERRRAREAARWYKVRTPQGLVEPALLDYELVLR